MAYIASDILGDPLLQVVVMYVGPDLILPLTSALAAVAGVALMFWQRLVGMVLKLWRMMFQRKG